MVGHKKEPTNDSAYSFIGSAYYGVFFSDDGYLKIFYFYQCFLFTLRTIERVVLQNDILSNSITGFSSANRATYPFRIVWLFMISYHFLIPSKSEMIPQSTNEKFPIENFLSVIFSASCLLSINSSVTITKNCLSD